MKKNNAAIWLLATMVFALLVTMLAMPDMVLHPGHVIPGLYSDSGKNTFTYLYQVLYGHGFWFAGMNYPYGEHIIYIDGEPALSVPLSYFTHISASGGLTVLWWLVALSYILSVVFVYKILVHFNVHPFVAMVFAGLISIFSPQLFRSLAHYGLSYACVVPMLFYWTIKYNFSSRARYAIYIFLLGSFTSFLHPYFSAVVLIWTTFYVAGYFIFHYCPTKNSIKFPITLIC